MSKISKEQLKEALASAESIAITVHVRPDGDAMGSLLAMYEALTSQGKDVRMVVDDTIPKKFASLPYGDRIVSVDQCHNFTPDMLLVLDASTFERIGRVGALFSAPIFNIDHHISNSEFADGLYLRADFAATCEIVADMCHDWAWPITESMANALYMGIATDCGFFKFSNTGDHTLEMAALCVKAGAKPQAISERIEATSALRLEMTKRAMQTIAFYKNNTIASIELDTYAMDQLGDDTDGFVELIRNVDTVDIAIFLKAESPNRTRVSLRSKESDVNAIAQQFGGGGHIRAAGLTIDGDIEEAKRRLLEVM